jgi:hypothetical protein
VKATAALTAFEFKRAAETAVARRRGERHLRDGERPEALVQIADLALDQTGADAPGARQRGDAGSDRA